MPIKTYPDDPDGLCETTLSPPEGSWVVLSPIPKSHIELTNFPAIGQKSVNVWWEETGDSVWFYDIRFRFNNGREFNGTRDQAKLNFWIAHPTGSNGVGVGHDTHIRLYDASGRYAEREYTSTVGSFEHFTFPLGQGIGWSEQADFDWRFIKEISFVRWGYLSWQVWFDEVHFSYYELEPALLTILSDPSGKQFRYDTTIRQTPYTVGLTPNTSITIWIDPTNFVHWDDGELSPTRTLTLQEAEKRAIQAIYQADGGGQNNILLAGLGGITVLVIIAYLYYKR